MTDPASMTCGARMLGFFANCIGSTKEKPCNCSVDRCCFNIFQNMNCTCCGGSITQHVAQGSTGEGGNQGIVKNQPISDSGTTDKVITTASSVFTGNTSSSGEESD